MGLRWAEVEARTDQAVGVFCRQLEQGEHYVIGVLAFPQLPTLTGRSRAEVPELTEFPLALAAATNQVFCFADPATGQRQVQLPLAKLTGYQARGYGEAMLMFDGPTPDVQATPALRLPPVLDMPAEMNAAAIGGFLSAIEEAWQNITGRPFDNQFPTRQ
jgi:hypothetical protein